MWRWLISPLGLKIAGGLVAAGLVTGTILHYRTKWKEEGRREGEQAAVEADKKVFEQIEERYREQLEAGREREVAMASLVKQFGFAAERSRQDFLAVLKEAQTDRQRVEQLPDAELKGDIERKMGGALELPSTLRKLDLIVTDYPYCVEAKGHLQEEIRLLHEKSNAQEAECAAVRSQRDRAIESWNELLPLYTRAFNAAMPKRGLWGKVCHIFTAGLKCKVKKLDLPEPVLLKKKGTHNNG